MRAIFQLMEHYHQLKDRRNLLKYHKMTSTLPLSWREWIRYVHYAIRHGFESVQSSQPLIRATPSDCLCHYYGLGILKSTEKALDTLQTLNSASCYSASATQTRIVSTCTIIITGTTKNLIPCDSRSNFISRRIILFSSSPCLTALTSTHRSSGNNVRFMRGAITALTPGLFLAHFYSRDACPNEREKTRHLRIAADAGHPDAQSVLPQLSGTTESASVEIRLLEEHRNDYQEEERINHA